MINEYIYRLINYGLSKNLIQREDSIYVANRLIDLLGMSAIEPFDFADDNENATLEQILCALTDYACENGLCAKVLEHAGVFKRDEKGMAAFDRFVYSL